jgi:hypothetical protein
MDDEQQEQRALSADALHRAVARAIDERLAEEALLMRHLEIEHKAELKRLRAARAALRKGRRK